MAFGRSIAALIVGNDNLGVLGRQIGGLGDYPYARFRPIRSGDQATNVGCADIDRSLLRASRQRGKCRGRGQRDGTTPDLSNHPHTSLPFGRLVDPRDAPTLER